MKFRTVLSIVVLAACCALAHSQTGCSAQYVAHEVKCQTNTCSSEVGQVVPAGGYGTASTVVYFSCCGRSIPSYNPGGLCYLTELRDPQVQQRLAKAASRSNILVANCEGQYSLYQPQDERQRKRFDVMSLDRILE